MIAVKCLTLFFIPLRSQSQNTRTFLIFIKIFGIILLESDEKSKLYLILKKEINRMMFNQNDPVEYIIRKAMEEGNINQAIAMRQYRMHEELNRKRELREMEDRIVKRVLSAFSI